MRKVEHPDFAKPDETREFPHGRAEIINTAEGAVGRLILQPGWRWSTDVKPIAGTEWCEAPHFQYHESGRLHVRMEDGTEFDVGPGQLTSLPAGHDAWVVGDETVVAIDFHGATDYAKR
jgi:mannose-6-phosphate isomerase-like protein (cupin superfamily)